MNPDTGMATENPNVREDSSCESPQKKDRQQLSAEGGSENNIHIDGCLFDSEGAPFDGTITFQSKGKGSIFACPDPDQRLAQAPQVMNGEKRSFTHDHNGDGLIDDCHQTGYQEKDAAGDLEYHVRVNNDAKPGRQKVVFCFDPEQDIEAAADEQPPGHGCKGAEHKDTIRIRWKR